VTQKVSAAVEDLAVTRSIGELTLRGFSRPVATFDVIGLDAARVAP
jgi:class 3 adenylate cyclase